jgi:hypothetical protein
MMPDVPFRFREGSNNNTPGCVGNAPASTNK